MHLDSVKHAETSVDVLAYDQRLEVVAGYVLLQAQVDLSTFDAVPGLGFAVRLAEVLSCERDVRIRVDREALTGSQQLDKQAGIGTETLDVCPPQPGFRLLIDRSFQRPTIGQDRDTRRRFASKCRCRCDPVLRLAVAGGRFSPEFRDLPAAPVKAARRTVGRKQDYVHEAVLLRTSEARRPPTKESPSPTVVGWLTSSVKPGMQRTTAPIRSSSAVAKDKAAGRTGRPRVSSYCSSV